MDQDRPTSRQARRRHEREQSRGDTGPRPRPVSYHHSETARDPVGASPQAHAHRYRDQYHGTEDDDRLRSRGERPSMTRRGTDPPQQQRDTREVQPSYEQLVQKYLLEHEMRVEAERLLERLQNEVLASIDRFDPSYDATITREFQLLNVDIGKLYSKSKLFRKLVLSDNSPPISQETSALWDDTVQWTAFAGKPATKEERKMMVRQAIWKFLAETLFDRARPFASFGDIGRQAELAKRICFHQLFPDHLNSENAARWRSLTVRQLAAIPAEEQETKQVRRDFALEFVGFLRDKTLIADNEEVLEQVKAAVLNTEEDLGKYLGLVLHRAIGFSRLIAGERAGYEVQAPQLSMVAFRKAEDDPCVTAKGAMVGVVDADREDDPEANVKLIGSPMLVKFGDGGGRNLHEQMVLVKAFAILCDD